MSISVHYFDTRRSQILPGTLHITADQIELHVAQAQKNFATLKTKLLEPFDNAALILEFPDGSHCEIVEPESKQALLRQLDYKATLIERWQSNWWLAGLAILVTVTICVGTFHYGAPWLAKRIVPLVPQAADNFLGKEAEQILRKQYLNPSSLTNPQYLQAINMFRRIQPAQTRVALRFELNLSGTIGPNAMALPHGSIFMTDQMFALFEHKNKQAGEELSAAGEYQLASVLAHEIGHIELRHSMHNIAASSMITTLVASLVGDYSTMLTVASGTLLHAQYSQEKEAEADEYAIRLLKANNISPAYAAQLFEILEKHAKVHKQGNDQFSWLTRQMEDYLSSHPSNQRRIARFKQAAQE